MSDRPPVSVTLPTFQRPRLVEPRPILPFPLPEDEEDFMAIASVDPGLYSGLSDQQYHRLPFVSNSLLGEVQKSPAHCRISADQVQSSTPSLIMGSAVHMAVLEPHLFDTRYYQLPAGLDFRRAADRTLRDAAYKTYGAEYVVRAEEYDVIKRIADSVHAHPAASELLAQPGHAEVSAFWDDSRTGMRCKARIDYLMEDLPIALDLKTTRSASPDEFGKSVFNFGYYRQNAFYRHGLAMLSRPIEAFKFICVEKEPPYAVAVYTLPERLIEAGLNELEELLYTYHRCLEENYWPYYSDEEQEIELPGWAWRALERRGVLPSKDQEDNDYRDDEIEQALIGLDVSF